MNELLDMRMGRSSTFAGSRTMSLIGFLIGSFIPHIIANGIPTAAYIAGTVQPFVAAHAGGAAAIAAAGAVGAAIARHK